MKSLTPFLACVLLTSATSFRPNQPFTGNLERGPEHHSLDRRQESGKKSPIKVPLEIDSRNNGKTELQWLATITVGTPPQTL